VQVNFNFNSNILVWLAFSASEVTTLWRYTNLFIIIIFFNFKPTNTKPQAGKLLLLLFGTFLINVCLSLRDRDIV